MKHMKLIPRICEYCGNEDIENIYNSKELVRTKSDVYSFEAYVSICSRCGFVFNSPCYSKEDLLQFYSDNLSISNELPTAFDSKKRVEFLSNFSLTNKRLVEIGGNNSLDFHDKLKSIFDSVSNIEVNSDCFSEIRDVSDLEEESSDIICHYDVLEHVPDVKQFLTSCYKALSNDGIMICEMPNLLLYPKNLMLLSVVHVNHFTPTSLIKLAESIGFYCIKISHYQSSRPFSFLSVFRKKYDTDNYKMLLTDNIVDQIEILNSKACLEAGINQINELKFNIAKLQDSITDTISNGGKVVLWCVTQLLELFLEQYKLPEGVIVIDSDPRKRNHFLNDHNIVVYQPNEKLRFIKDSELLAIFSPRNWKSINSWLNLKHYKNGDDKKVIAIGVGKYGEPLQV